jgi:CHRD domain
MRLKLFVQSLAVLMLGVAACGSSSNSSSSSKAGSPTAKRAGPVRIYRVALAGTAETPRGAPAGTGAAVISIHGSSLVCWRFAHLHGFTNATVAHIHLGAARKSGKVIVPLSTGPRLHHRGCVRVRTAVAKAIENSPRDYYVNIHSTPYPGGAVRGQL